MDHPFLPHYFRNFRRLYSCELQLMSFLPELKSSTGSKHLREEIEDLVGFCRERRNTLELLALSHGFSAAGDECSEMATLINTEWKALQKGYAVDFQNDFVSDLCEALHRKLIQDYCIARSLAAKVGFADDVEGFDAVIDRLIGAFPEVWSRTGRSFSAVAA